MALPIPVFVPNDPAQIIAEQVAFYEAQVGRTLEPAQVERLLISNFAYRESLIRQQANNAALQCLLAFATFPVIDYLGELVGVQRLPAAPASAPVLFTLSAGHTGVTLPAGLRIQSTDGKAVFVLASDVQVLAGVLTATAVCLAQNAGASGNGFAAGVVSNILDPQAFLATAANTDATGGGADEESDDELRDRIRLAPASFSVAGPSGAYKFHAKSAHPSITDVGVDSTTPGTVDVYPLSTLGLPTPPAVLTAVEAVLNDERIRPLSDTVVVASPSPINYAIVAQLIAITGEDVGEVQATGVAAAQAYADRKKSGLGLDAVRTQIIAALGADAAVYSVNLLQPAADVVTLPNEVAICTGITITVPASHDA